ncbi:hypothetical protein [Actinoplanes sp. ATCC 53533]|uniref:DUF6932 family protein n=1 Tax=Actinoplanes sp. ATCC 53533 TaxID=1288362 RepID=UPI000F7B3F7C|nr:hypothetical protein [Actinoplanes sp. ATCC 53533]
MVSIDEVHEPFVDDFPGSKTRATLFQQWIDHRNAISRFAPIQHQWVDGSYTTSKVDPGDIDLVTFINIEDLDNIPLPDRPLFKSLVNGHSTRAAWGIDSFMVPITPDTHPGHSASVKLRGSFLRLFTGVRESDTIVKGILEVRDGE